MTDTTAADERVYAIGCDVLDTLRALANGRPVPEHVHRNRQTRAKQRAIEQARREPLDLDLEDS